MAVTTRRLNRHRDYSRLFIALAVLAGAIALAPIVAAIAGLGGAGVGSRTAFATAPAGEYAVLGRTEGAVDIVSVARADKPEAVTEIARVPHLDGFTSTGAVAPDGKRVALVVADGGTASHPRAALVVVDLESGRTVRAAENVQPGQTPVWSPNGSDVLFTRAPAGNEAQGPTDLLQVSRSGDGERRLRTFDGVLGAYPIGFDSSGQPVTVVLGREGSLLSRGSAPAMLLTENLSRDWKLSPDGKQVAFIEVETRTGVAYVARSVSLDGTRVEALSASVSALGTAWNPASNTASFGTEPGAGGARAQALSTESGFDVPLGYSASGSALAVNHWTGESFDSPGSPELQVVAGEARSRFHGQTRFFGWSSR